MKLALSKPMESDEQKSAVEYVIARGLAQYLVMIPNGTQLPGNARVRGMYMNYLKAMGLRPGAYDLFLAYPRGKFHGAWFEMKRAKPERSEWSKEQREFGGLMDGQGYFTAVCYGVDDFRSALERYLRSK